jgi:hypothetical protein
LPDSLKGLPLDIEFISLLAQAQKASNLGGTEALARMGAALAQLRPEVLDNLDTDYMLGNYNEMLGNKEKYIIAVSNYAESLGIDTNKKGISMVEDEIKLAENPVFKPLTKEQRNAYLEKARELLSKGGGVKIIK